MGFKIICSYCPTKTINVLEKLDKQYLIFFFIFFYLFIYFFFFFFFVLKEASGPRVKSAGCKNAIKPLSGLVY